MVNINLGGCDSFVNNAEYKEYVDKALAAFDVLDQLNYLAGQRVDHCNAMAQLGVEAYKKNMFALLRKPGYEEQTEAILKRI